MIIAGMEDFFNIRKYAVIAHHLKGWVTGKLPFQQQKKMSSKPTWFLRIRNFTIKAKEIFLLLWETF